MTIDKIKHYMQPIIFEYWHNCRDIEAIKKAEKDLSSEIEAGILKGIEFVAELKFLRHLLTTK